MIRTATKWIPGTNIIYQSHDVKFGDEEIVRSKSDFVRLSRETHDKSVEEHEKDVDSSDDENSEPEESATCPDTVIQAVLEVARTGRSLSGLMILSV